MAWRMSRFSAAWLPISMAMRLADPLDFRKPLRLLLHDPEGVHALNFRTILDSQGSSDAFDRTGARYRSIARVSSGALIS